MSFTDNMRAKSNTNTSAKEITDSQKLLLIKILSAQPEVSDSNIVTLINTLTYINEWDRIESIFKNAFGYENMTDFYDLCKKVNDTIYVRAIYMRQNQLDVLKGLRFILEAIDDKSDTEDALKTDQKPESVKKTHKVVVRKHTSYK